PVYQLPDWPIDGMVSQLVFVDGCTGVGRPSICNPAGIDQGSDCAANATDIDTHSYVKNCSNVANIIACRLLVGQVPGCSPLTSASLPLTLTSAPLAVSEIGGAAVTTTGSGLAPVPQLSGQISPSVLSPGQRASVSGFGFGSTPGRIQFTDASGGSADAI